MNNASDAASAGRAFGDYLRWASTVEWSDIPTPARRRTAMVLADDLGATFSALGEPEVGKAHERLVEASRGVGTASLLTSGRPRLPVLQAAMGNGLAMGWNELDEGYRKAVCHAGLYVLPALLAVAEAEDASMQDLLRALALGYETVTRVARTWRMQSMTIHPHALLSPIGAAAGVGFLRRLPVEQLESAIAGAATAAMVGPFNHAPSGVLARNTWAAQGAVAGLNAIEWAACGIGGASRSPYDVMVGVLGASQDLSVLQARAEDGWAVEFGYQKMNACCQYAHSTIEAIQSLLEREPQLEGGEAITGISIEAHPLAYALDDHAPRTTLGAKFSLPHAASAALVHGNGGVASFDAASLRDPRVSRLREVVVLRPFEGTRAWPDDRPSRVTVETRSGERFSEECWSARGGPDRPFAEEEIWRKLEGLSRSHAPSCGTVLRRVVDACDGASETLLHAPWRRCLDDCFASPGRATTAMST